MKNSRLSSYKRSFLIVKIRSNPLNQWVIYFTQLYLFSNYPMYNYFIIIIDVIQLSDCYLFYQKIVHDDTYIIITL